MGSCCKSHYLVCNTTRPFHSICNALTWHLSTSHTSHATSVCKLLVIWRFWHIPQVKNSFLGSSGQSVERLSKSNHSYTLESGSLAAAHKPQQLRMHLLLRSLEQAVSVQSLRSCSVAYWLGHCRHCHSRWGQEGVEDLPLRPTCC